MSPEEIKEQMKGIANSGTTIDFIGIEEKVHNIEGISSLIFGIIVVIIVGIMGIITLVDILYLSFPTITYLIDKYKLDGSRKKYLRLISKDAMKALEISIQEDQPLLYRYILIRIKTYLIASLVLMLLLAGMGYIINIISRPITNTINIWK